MASITKRIAAAFTGNAADRLQKAREQVVRCKADLHLGLVAIEQLTQQLAESIDDAEEHAALGQKLFAASLERKRLEALASRAESALPPLERAAAEEAAAEAVNLAAMTATLSATRADALVRAYREMTIAHAALTEATEAAQAQHERAKELTAGLGDVPESLKHSPRITSAAQVAVLSTDLAIQPIDRKYALHLAGKRSDDELLVHLADLYQLPHASLYELEWPRHEQLAALRKSPATWRTKFDELAKRDAERHAAVLAQVAKQEIEKRAAMERELAGAINQGFSAP